MGARLYVSNLPLSATEEMLVTRFCKFGDVVSVTLEPQRRPQRRAAFVEMNTSAAAHKAIAALNLSEFDGRLVSVYLALGSAPRKPA
jgi:RNA recognition motif-containing protein